MALGAALATSAPASATRFDVFASGTLLQSAAPNQTLNGLPFGTGSGVFGHWTVDIRAGTPVDQTPPGSPTTGQAKLVFGSVKNGFIGIQSSAGDIFLTQSNASLGAIYALNDVAAGPERRIDQLTISDGARPATMGLAYGYTNNTGGFLPPGVFLGSVAFGRSVIGTVAAPPTFLQSLENIDPFALWQTGPYLFGLNFRSGTATTQAQYLALPVRSFNVINVTAFLTPLADVPEPSTWVMLIAGFGLVGAAARRRRMVAV